MKLTGLNVLLLAGIAGGFLLLFGGMATTAEAQTRRVFIYRPYHRFWFPYYEPTVRVYDPIASQREEGYSEGRDAGKDDAKEGNDADPKNHKKFSKSKSYAYRQAFLAGYEDGFRKQSKKDK